MVKVITLVVEIFTESTLITKNFGIITNRGSEMPPGIGPIMLFLNETHHLRFDMVWNISCVLDTILTSAIFCKSKMKDVVPSPQEVPKMI